MLILSLNFSLVMYLSSLMCIILKCKHLLLMLLSLEYVVLSTYFAMFVVLSYISSDFYFCLIFIVMMVCESALGLSLLVLMVRSYGNDYFQSLNVLW